MTIQLQQPVVCPLLIGRSAELIALQAYSVQAAAGQGGVVQLSGEAGVGKSRLVTELQRATIAHGFQLLRGQCFPTDHACPYAPLLDLLRAFLASRSPAEIAAALGPGARVLFPLLPEPLQYLPELASLPPLPALDPEQEKRRLFTTLAEVFTRQASTRPVLLVMEDLHWSDENTLEFLLFFARQCAAHPILLLLTARHDEGGPSFQHWRAQLDREHLRQELVLERLTRADTKTMLQILLPEARSLPTGLLDALYDLTEGNPFFLEEALKALIMAEELVWGGEGWRWERAATWHIPLSLHDTVEQRVTRVSADAQQVLQLAAVAGRRFDFDLLQQITQYDEAALLALIKELIAAQLVVEESAEQFAFRHALTQQAIAGGLLARERRALHRRIAWTLAQRYAPAPEAHLADLAYHYTAAELWTEAMAYAQRAAEQAHALSAPGAAVEQWTRVLHAAQQLGQAVPPRTYRARGQAWETLGNFEQAQADYERALQAAREMGDGRAQWQSLLDLGSLWAGHDYEQVGVYFQQAVELAGQLGDAGLHAHSLNRHANWLLNTGQIAAARATQHAALALFEAQHDPAGMAEALDLLGTVYGIEGDAVNAVLMYGRAIEILRGLDNRPVLCSCLTMRAAFASPWSGHVNCLVNWSRVDCERDVAEALHLAQALQSAAGEAFAEIIFGGVLTAFGQLGAGLTHGQQGLRLATEINHPQWIVGAHDALARIYLTLLAPEQALAHVEGGRAAARELGSAFWTPSLVADQMQAYALLGQPHRAEAALHEVRAEAENPRQGTERDLLLAWAELALVQHQPALALQRCEQLLQTAPQRAGATADQVIPRLWQCQGEALAALGRSAEALAVLEEARRGAQLQQYGSLSWQIERSLGRVYQRQRRPIEAQQAFAAARQGIATLAVSIADPALREHFAQAAQATLPPEKTVSRRRATAEQYGGLTAREQEVAARIGQGHSNAEIAERLVVSKRTVETYVSNVLAKLGLTSRAQIAIWARDKGLAQREP